ncbi:hypothetical protein BOG92_054030 [Streptomyces sp. WAC00263]|nr:hypothetical protein BOG92_054030 [Streptomyces sp. WAC00263]
MREQAWQRFRSSGRRSGRRRASPAAVAVAVGVMTMDALAPPAASSASHGRCRGQRPCAAEPRHWEIISIGDRVALYVC